MKINYNMAALVTNNALRRNQSTLDESTERLSSGFRINSAKDAPAGIAIARKMNAQIRGLQTAAKNASDGISVIETADGALTEIHDMLGRMNQLAVKGANGTMLDEDREAIEKEIRELKSEINRIAENTEYNGQVLFDGTFDLNGYTDTRGVKVESYSDRTDAGNYVAQITFDADGNPLTASILGQGVASDDGMISTKTFNTQSFEIHSDLHTVTIKGDDEASITLDIDAERIRAAGATSMKVGIELTQTGEMRFQIGANEGQVLEVRIPRVSTKNLGIEHIDLSTQKGCQEAISDIDRATGRLSEIRSRLGAYQNRLEHTVASLDVTDENMTSAYSRIMDTDMAEEMTRYTTYQVLTQAGTAMLSQANERPAQALQLLQ